MLGAYIFIIVISSSWIDPLVIMQCPSLSLVKVFILKFILSDMSIATPAFFFFFLIFIYLFLVVLGLRFCARALSSCGEQGPLFIAVREPLTVAASLVAEHKLQMRRLSSCGSRAQLLRGMWDPPRPGLEPVSPALAGRFSTTAPPGKPPFDFHLHGISFSISSLSVCMCPQV